MKQVAGELAEWFKITYTFPEDPSSVPTTHARWLTAVWGTDAVFWAHTASAHMHIPTSVHTIKS